MSPASEMSTLHSLDLLPWGDCHPPALEVGISREGETDGKLENMLAGSLQKIHCLALEINRWASEEPFISRVLFLFCVLGGKQKLGIAK